MKLRTEVFPNSLLNKLTHQSAVLSLGSCFSNNIGEKLTQHGFNVSNNPLGIIFNPINIVALLNKCIRKEALIDSLVLEQNGTWLSHELHSQHRANSKKELLQLFHNTAAQTAEALNKSTHIIITFGTAFYYTHTPTNKVVTNCHKIPQSFFTKNLASVKDITNAYLQIAPLFQDKNVILTLSPVRHTKDGMEENAVSKATLRLALHEIVKKHTNTYYFPAYEIFTDDLRDYRFYSEDLIHPNNTGIEYSWQKFKEIAFSKETDMLSQKVFSLQKAINHKVEKSTPHYVFFLEETLKKAYELHPSINLEKEITFLKNKLAEISK